MNDHAQYLRDRIAGYQADHKDAVAAVVEANNKQLWGLFHDCSGKAKMTAAFINELTAALANYESTVPTTTNIDTSNHVMD